MLDSTRALQSRTILRKNLEKSQKIFKKITKGLYTGKEINHQDHRYDLAGGYGRKLLSDIYTPRINCGGVTNFWKNI